MLKDNFYTITDMQKSEGAVRTSIELDPAHIIFKGHFPSVPVVPGVCMVQIIKELLIETLQQELILRKADHLKFLTVINPQETGSVKVEISYASTEENQLKVTAAIVNENVSYFKFKGIFSVL
jgi:3-hydroxyacyl-[acyl-carrier-protein] dehydratase